MSRVLVSRLAPRGLLAETPGRFYFGSCSRGTLFRRRCGRAAVGAERDARRGRGALGEPLSRLGSQDAGSARADPSRARHTPCAGLCVVGGSADTAGEAAKLVKRKKSVSEVRREPGSRRSVPAPRRIHSPVNFDLNHDRYLRRTAKNLGRQAGRAVRQVGARAPRGALPPGRLSKAFVGSAGRPCGGSG